MTKKRLDALYPLLLGCAASLLLGLAMEVALPDSMMDFKVLYYGAQSLVHHADPYQHGEILRRYSADGGALPPGAVHQRIAQDVLSECIYPPSALLLVAPLSLLPYAAAHLVWLALLMGSFVLAAFLAWDLAAARDPILAALLAAFILANNVIGIAVGNSAILVVGLCVIAVWCLVRRRFVWAGVLLLAIAMAIKPHDALWIWLILLLAGGRLRRDALRSFVALVVICVPAFVWATQVAPAWLHELGVNVAALSAPGGLSDPSLAAKGDRAVSMIVNLQAIFSGFTPNPHLYNGLSYLVCVPLVVLWAWTALRSGPSTVKLWLGLAALIPLAMLPIYHRPYDAKLLLLAIPAIVLFRHQRSAIATTAFWLNCLVILLNADLLWMGLQMLIPKLHLVNGGIGQRIFTLIWVYPVPLTLLAAGIVNVFLYRGYCCGSIAFEAATDSGVSPPAPAVP